MNSWSSEEDEISKLGSGELNNLTTNHRRKNLKLHRENFLNLDDCINANYNYESLRSRIVSHLNSDKNNKNSKSSTQEDLVPITFGELIPQDKIRKNDSKNMSVLQNDVRSNSRYVKILMDSCVNASIIQDLFAHANIFCTRKSSTNKWSTMAGSFSTSCEAKINWHTQL